jgi:hypothetical protein
MKHACRIMAVAFVSAVLLVSLTIAQQQAQPAAELYHIHVVKAAPGKLPQLLNEYRNSPAPPQGQPQVHPIILRHNQGSEWDFVVITPRGRQTTISAEPLPQAVQAYNQRLQALTDWHGDTFAVGPAWATVQRALLPDRDAQQTVYVVSDYRSLPGHRQQLRQVLDGNAQDTPGRAVIFTHAEGAPWNFFFVTRYNSWAEIGAPPEGQEAQQEDPGIPIREHMAVHHDTICSYVAGGQPRQ